MQPEPTDDQLETPLEDAAEQAAPVDPSDEETLDEVADATVHRGLEVDEWDAVEQARIVALDDDEER